MKRLSFAAAALSLMASPAFAQTTHGLEFNGTVAPMCHLPVVNHVHDLTAMLQIGDDGHFVGGSSIVFNLTDEFGGATAWCNTVATVEVRGNRLVHESLPADTTASAHGNNPVGFTRTVPMVLRNFNVGGLAFPSPLNTGSNLDGIPQSLTSTGPFAGPITGRFELLRGANRPWAGDYRATWTLTFTPS